MAERLNVSLVHCGAREAIIGKKLVESTNYNVRLDVLGKFVNPLLYNLTETSNGTYHIIDTADKNSILEMARRCSKSDLVVIGNEAPIINGLADELRKEGKAVIGPNKKFALEGDKYKTRLRLEEVCPQANPKFYYIDPRRRGWEEEVGRAIKALDGKVALKPIEPKYGKGVIVEGSHFPAENAYEKALDIAKAGPFLIEEKIVGEEWSGQHLYDSKGHMQSFYATRDLKRALENDKGDNTGGMATFSDNNEILPYMKKKEFDDGEMIVRKFMEKLSETEGYGVLTSVVYPAWIISNNGILKMLEINNRFGDGEGLNALSVLKNDLVEVFLSMVAGNLPRLEFERKATTMLYAVPLTYGGFLNEYSGDKTIRVDEKGLSPQTQIYPASVELVNGAWRVMSSRSIAFVSTADTLGESFRILKEDIKRVNGPVRYRTDFGMEYVERCIENMEELRRREE